MSPQQFANKHLLSLKQAIKEQFFNGPIGFGNPLVSVHVYLYTRYRENPNILR